MDGLLNNAPCGFLSLADDGIGACVARTLVNVGADLTGVTLRRALADGLQFVCGLPANK
jgi:Ni,Fe-hydrogenase maturation factor